jgi:hypothetical protein
MELSGQIHAPAALFLAKEPPMTHWIAGCVSFRAGLDVVKKIRNFTAAENLTSPLQVVARCYTD